MKENDILKEQRKAREEFLKLKKMQSGELDAGPKPSEIEIVPKTAGEKFSNIWFHYKWLIIGCVTMAVIIAFLITQCTTKTKYDLRIAIYTENYVPDTSIERLADYFEQYCDDVDGNGEVYIQIVNCSYNKNSTNLDNISTLTTKIQSLIAADETTMLYITDSNTYEHLSSISDNVKFFDGSPTLLGTDFYETCDTDPSLPLPENLQISCRNLGKDIAISNNKNAKTYHDASAKIIEKIKEIG